MISCRHYLRSKAKYLVGKNRRFISSNQTHAKNNHATSISFVGALAVLSGITYFELQDNGQCNMKDVQKYIRVDIDRKEESEMIACSMNTSTPIGSSTKDHISSEKKVESDFVIVGFGNSGKAAFKYIRENEPNARISIVNPHEISHALQNQDLNTRTKSNVHSVTGNAMKLDHENQILEIMSNEGVKRLHYKHSILIATGSHGAPIPSSLVDERITERVLELRSTQLPALNYKIMRESMKDSSSNSSIPLFPSLPSQSVRQIALMAASEGNKVCILGSGLEAIEIATSVSAMQDMKKNKTCLVFGNSGPLGDLVPKYLSTAITKRFKMNGIEVADRSLVRYIASLEGSKREKDGAVEIHTVKSFDNMETKRVQADLVIVAPNIGGEQGCASVPVSNSSSAPLFTPWSKLLSDPVMSCYSDDSRIVVNAELSAASNVYAAGGVAKFPDHVTGHARVAGEGLIDSSKAGRIAAKNMIKNFQKATRKNQDSKKTNVLSCTNSLPISRSDQIATAMINGKSKSSLASAGIHFLCVGSCNSQTMSTHGFFWTNRSRKLTRRRSNVGTDEQGKPQRAIFGSGIVYYLDRAGTIRGIMIWGLPFTKSSKSDKLNKTLVHRMEEIINSNGLVMQKDHHEAIKKMGLDTTLLNPSHLAEESRVLATIAVNASQEFTLRKKMPMPLHRYCSAKPIQITKLGVLKKNAKIGSGGVGEDIFERSGHDMGAYENERSRHPSLIHYFQYDWNSTMPIPLDPEDPEDYVDTNEITYQALKNNFAARPTKEEPLWLRKGDVQKSQSMADRAALMFMQNIKLGQFNDGKDAVKQAPVPQVYNDVKEFFKGNNEK